METASIIPKNKINYALKQQENIGEPVEWNNIFQWVSMLKCHNCHLPFRFVLQKNTTGIVMIAEV